MPSLKLADPRCLPPLLVLVGYIFASAYLYHVRIRFVPTHIHANESQPRPGTHNATARIWPPQVKTASARPVPVPSAPSRPGETVQQPKFKDTSPEIRRGTFLYLVMGAGYPEERWLKRASWQNVSLLYMSWRENTTRAVGHMDAKKFLYMYFPKSTWTMGRNRQASAAHAWEIEQQWLFEYFVFFDSDTVLSYRTPNNPARVVLDIANDDTAVQRFNAILLRDRPMKAGLGFNEFPWNANNFRCQRRCQVDNMVHAYHRTASSVLEPYNGHFDDSNWWASAYSLNMYISMMASDFCNYYLEVLIENKGNAHSQYPRNMDWLPVMRYVNKCISLAGVPGFSEQSSIDEIKRKLQTDLGREPTGWPTCKRMDAGVDYRPLLHARNATATWAKSCH